MDTDEKKFMEKAIELARLGEGYTSPNPIVGAVIVKDGRIIGEGYHMRYGELHAERNALKHCLEDPKDATMYVTLEPCCHQGKQPPCVEAIIAAKIGRVVIGSYDPNPLVSGKGIAVLRERGIAVTEGFLQKECDALNPVFFHFIQNKMPYVILKYAMTMDGKIATASGDSKWITGEKAREHVHHSRHRYSAIMVGIGTVLADDPMLNCRMEKGKNPVRIICDTKLSIPLESQIVRTAREIPTIIATCCTDFIRIARYKESGCEILEIPQKDGGVDLVILMQILGQMGIDSVYVEGGGSLHFSLLQHGLVQSVHTYIAPKIIGGKEAKTPVEGIGFFMMKDAVSFDISKVLQLDEDIFIETIKR